MCRKSEDFITENPGSYYSTSLAGLVLTVACVFFGMTSLGTAQSYFVNAYVSPGDSASLFKQVQTIVVDLDQKATTGNIVLADSGTILDKVPISLSNVRGRFLVSFWAVGMMAKNSGFGGGISNLRYSITRYQDGNMRVLREAEVPAASINLLDQALDDGGFRLGVVSDTGDAVVMQPGIYRINNQDRLSFERGVSIDEIPGSIGNLGGFALLRKVWGADQYHLYHSFHKTQFWLVKLDDVDGSVLDSLQLRQSGGQATIYAFHPTRDRFYCFHLNYEIHGQYTHKYRDDYYIEPEVLIYDPATLQLLEQHPIADYPEGQYPGRENGLAEVVGDYIVYYFFEDDWQGIFAPAMLFIFDTRTNEASWLRVGWR
jgi:hypothetical protein